MQAEALGVKLEALRVLLSERWAVQPLYETAYIFGLEMEAAQVICYARIDPEVDAFLMNIVNRVAVDPGHSSLVVQYMNYINHALPIGHWELQHVGEELIAAWRSGIYFKQLDLSTTLMRRVIDSSLYFVAETLAGIVVLQDGGTIEQAIAAIGADFRHRLLPSS